MELNLKVALWETLKGGLEALLASGQGRGWTAGNQRKMTPGQFAHKPLPKGQSCKESTT